MIVKMSLKDNHDDIKKAFLLFRDSNKVFYDYNIENYNI